MLLGLLILVLLTSSGDSPGLAYSSKSQTAETTSSYILISAQCHRKGAVPLYSLDTRRALSYHATSCYWVIYL